MTLWTGAADELHPIAKQKWEQLFPDIKFSEAYPQQVWRKKVRQGIAIGTHYFKATAIALIADALPGTMAERSKPPR